MLRAIAGEVKTPTFYRHDIGVAPGRLHEPSADEEGNLWTSPLDGTLWKYHTPTGKVEILDLKTLTGRDWKGLHLWPVAHGHEVYLCCPSLPRLWVYESGTKRVKQYGFPHANPEVYGGFAAKGSPWTYFYDTRAPGILKWNATSHTGTFHPCPYTLSGTLYMTFLEEKRKEIWGSTYTGNDLVRFDSRVDRWTGQWKSPLEKATPTPANEVFGDTLYLSDHLNGRLVPFNAKTGKWGEPIAIPGYGEWFGYVSGGWVHGGLIYCCHSTWVGGNDSIDGKPHHFLGTWTVFDPKTGKFSRLDLPVQGSEDFMSDYAATVNGQLYLLAVNSNPPNNAVILSTSR